MAKIAVKDRYAVIFAIQPLVELTIRASALMLRAVCFFRFIQRAHVFLCRRRSIGMRMKAK